MSLCMCVGEGLQGYRGSYFLTVQKGSEQPQQWLQFINTFIYTIVFFSRREEVLFAVYRPLMPPC